jgi:para-nitrobenzyl esterase
MQSCKVTSSVLVICLILIGFSFLAGCTQKGPDAGLVKTDDIVVKTDAGSVSGLQQGSLRVYTGIPFAAPPTGDLRWRPPAPVQPWSGVKETKLYSTACPQPAAVDPTLNMSEDCLYLNVWTPAKSADEKLPVMVFFHGGAFGTIAGNMPLYNGTALAQKGVIVVTTNYRVGALGFLAHPQLDNESPYNVSGNYGLLDQIAALQWVQRNIGQFGGDPSRVTVFGESAGAASTLIHLVSPASTGLYRQAIVESGPLWTNGSIASIVDPKVKAEQWGEEYAKSLGYQGPDAIRQMRNVSSGDLVNATPWPSSSFWLVHTLRFKPVIDGWLIPDSPDTLYRLHRENPVPLIIGTNSDEGATLAADANMTVPEYKTLVQNRFGKDADTVLAKYPANSTAEVQIRLEQILTDYEFKDAAKFVAGSMADLNTSTYLYRYSYVLPGQPYGAFHGSEAVLLFKVPKRPDPVTDSVSDNLVDLWTRFAKTGNPNGGMNVTWPKYTRDGGRYLDIGAVPIVKSGY